MFTGTRIAVLLSFAHAASGEMVAVVGYMSGASNVNYWLRQHKLEASKELVDAILARAKSTDHILTDEEILAVVADVRGNKA